MIYATTEFQIFSLVYSSLYGFHQSQIFVIHSLMPTYYLLGVILHIYFVVLLPRSNVTSFTTNAFCEVYFKWIQPMKHFMYHAVSRHCSLI